MKHATFKEMFKILEPTLPTERIKYREQIADIYEARRSFVSLDNEEPKRKGAALYEKNPDVCFEYLNYTVSQGQRYCEVIIVKHVNVDYSLFIQTRDRTAKAPVDYQAMDELITIKAHEETRKIQIQVVDDAQVEPDEDFEIVLLDELTKKRLPGDDTLCKVTITEDC